MMLQALAFLAQAPGALRFEADLAELPETQSRKLSSILRAKRGSELARRYRLDEVGSLADFRARVPVSNYETWAADVAAQRNSPTEAILRGVQERLNRFEPTSGSTHARKWIPYTDTFLRELDAAAAPWLFDMGRRHPQILTGRHYWSLSWLPDELRAELPSTDDLELFPWWKRELLRRTMAVSSAISRLPTLEDCLDEGLAQLCAARDLSFVSVWSPTYWLSLMRRLGERREAVAARLPASQRPLAQRLREWDGGLSSEFLRTLWPRLALISCWTSSTAAAWIPALRALFPHATIEGKGLWATEGAVTIPFREQNVLAYRSHFYEFRDLDSGRIYLPDELRPGQAVETVLTSGSGLLRYVLPDRLRVGGTLGAVPTFEFLGRVHTVDLTGEKLDASSVESRLRQLSERFGVRVVTLYGLATTPARYVALVEGSTAAASAGGLGAALEHSLLEIHHYRLSRELGQLGPVSLKVVPDATRFMLEHARGLAGQMKIESVQLWNAGTEQLSNDVV